MSTRTEDKKKPHADKTSVKIDKELHQELKIEAAKKGITLQQLIEQKLKKAS